MTALRLVQPGDNDNGGELPPIDRYEIYLRGAGRSHRTIEDSLLTLRRIERETGYPVSHLPALSISRFLGEFRNGRTRYTYHSHLALFYKWLSRADGVPNPMEHVPAPKMPKCTPRPITNEELRNLLALRLRAGTRAKILLAAFQGLRVHEIAKIRGEDFDLTAGLLWVVGKGGGRKNLPVHAYVAELAVTMPTRGMWFPSPARSRAGLPVRSNCVSDAISEAMIRAGITGGTAHRLRHWYATELVRSGTDLWTAQTLMRHENLASTAIYTQVSDAGRVEAIKRLTLD